MRNSAESVALSGTRFGGLASPDEAERTSRIVVRDGSMEIDMVAERRALSFLSGRCGARERRLHSPGCGYLVSIGYLYAD